MEAMIDRDALTRYVDRVLVLHAERKSLNGDVAEVYEEAKSAGFVTRIIRQIVREKQMDADERDAHYNLLDSYRHALGMLADTPLGQAALERPRPFAEQPVVAGMRGSAAPVHRPRRRSQKAPDLVDDMIDTANRAKPRGRPRKADRDDDALKRALDAEPAGAA